MIDISAGAVTQALRNRDQAVFQQLYHAYNEALYLSEEALQFLSDNSSFYETADYILLQKELLQHLQGLPQAYTNTRHYQEALDRMGGKDDWLQHVWWDP